MYAVSPDADGAYEPADAFALARAPKDRLKSRDAWEFFGGLDGTGGEPKWTPDMAGRAPVLRRPGRCSRSGVTYVPALRRYLWVVTLPSKQEPGQAWSGLTVYEAPEPWGPWTRVFEADPWDVDPSDSASFPSKWLSPDGRSGHLVFAGDDSFSVRRAAFVLAAGEDRPAAD